MALWALKRSAEAVAAWRVVANPEGDAVKCVGRWILQQLRADPYQPNAGPVGDGFPITTWFANVPCRLSNGRRVVCTYDINDADHTITIYTVTDLAEPI